MITSQKELKRAIYDKKSKLLPKDIFLSPEYNVFLTHMTQGVTKTAHEYESMMYAEKEGDVAYTDGRKTYINYEAPVVADLTSEERHSFYCGLNLHENGHLLFTDFALRKKSIEMMQKGTIYPSPASNRYVDELERYLATEDVNAAIRLYDNLDNCIEDGFVDRAVCKLAPGYADCLRYENQVLQPLDFSSYEEMNRKKKSKTAIFTNMVHTYAVYGKMAYDESTPKDEVLESFEEILPDIRKAVFESSPFKRKKLILNVFCHMFHFFEQQSKQNQQNRQSQGGSDSSWEQNNQSGQNDSGQQGANEQSNQSQDQQNSQTSADGNGNSPAQSTQQNSLSQILQDAASILPSNQTEHKNPTAPDTQAIQNLSSADNTEQKLSASTTPLSPTIGKDELNALAEKIAQSKVQEQQEKELTKKMGTDVKMFLDGVQVHKGINCITSRISLTSTGRMKYNAQHHELDLIVKRFLKEFLKEIKDRQIGDTQRGLYCGKRISARDVHRYDKRIFSNKIAPEDIPDMAVGILIDASGSMSGIKLDYAIRCAYITYQFCQKLAIPCFVVAHTTSDAKVKLIDVVDENSIDGKDAQRIFEVDSGDCNRDGYALRYCLGRLNRIEADDRIMLIISDGMPNHDGYGFESGKKDIQSAVKDAVKKGITTIAAAIDDAATIKKLYQDDISAKYAAKYMDLSNLDKLPKAFVKILKEKLS